MVRISKKNLKKIIVFYIFIILTFSIFTIYPVSSLETSWRSPSEEGDSYSNWNNPSNVYTADDNYASGYGDQDFYNFNLNIPSDSIVDGVIVSVKGRKKTGYPDPGSLSLDCSLTWNDYGDETSTKSQTWDNTLFFEYKEFGGSTDTWGRSWSYNDFSNSNFRVHFNALNTGYIDHVRVKVYYSNSNNPPETTLDNIPNPAENIDVSTITGSATDTDGTISSVSLQISNDTDATFWTGSNWASLGNYVYSTSDDGDFDESSEDWTYNCQSAGINWADEKQYTITAIAYDNDLDWDPTSATDTFVFSSSTENNAPTAQYLSGADSIQYAGKQYSFTTRHQDTDGASDIESADAAIGSSFNDISFRCDPNSGSNPSVTMQHGSNYIISASASKSIIANGFDITWTYTLDWDWTHDDASDIDYFAHTTDENGDQSDWDLSNQNADYENEIIVKSVSFTLSDSAYSEDANTILTDGEWFRGGVDVKATGIICYEGTTSVYPPSNACDVRLNANGADSGKDDTNLGIAGEFDTGFYTTPKNNGVDNDFDFEIVLENMLSPNQGTGGADLDINSARDNQAPSAPTNVRCRPDGYTDTGELDDDTNIYLTWTNADDGDGSGISTDVENHGTHYAEIGDDSPDEIANNDGQDSDVGSSGTITYYVRAVDNVGNFGAVGSDTIKIDITSPSCIIEYDSSKSTFREGEILRINAVFTIAASDIDEDSVNIEIQTQGNGDLSLTSMTKISNTNWYYDWTIPSGIDEDGKFTVRIYGQDEAGKSISPNPTIDSSREIDNSAPLESELSIISPTTANEKTIFEVTVISNGLGVENVLLTLNGLNYYTGANGIAQITSPEVDEDTTYTIFATKTGFTDSSEDIIVKNIVEIKQGTIRGIVTDEESNPLENVLVCILLTDYFNTYRCTYSDSNGEYTISADAPETYIISAKKQGYNTSYDSVKVNPDSESIVNFILQKNQSLKDKSDEEIFVDYLVEDSIQKNDAGAKIDIKNNEVLILSDKIVSTIEEVKLDDSIKIKISGPETTSGKIFFIKVTSETFPSIDDINDFELKYDGEPIKKKSLDYILDFKHKPDYKTSYALISSIENDKKVFYFVIPNDSFSEHTISIFNIAETIEEVVYGIVAFSYNILFISIVAIAVAGITFRRIRQS